MQADRVRIIGRSSYFAIGVAVLGVFVGPAFAKDPVAVPRGIVDVPIPAITIDYLFESPMPIVDVLAVDAFGRALRAVPMLEAAGPVQLQDGSSLKAGAPILAGDTVLGGAIQNVGPTPVLIAFADGTEVILQSTESAAAAQASKLIGSHTAECQCTCDMPTGCSSCSASWDTSANGGDQCGASNGNSCGCTTPCSQGNGTLSGCHRVYVPAEEAQ